MKCKRKKVTAAFKKKRQGHFHASMLSVIKHCTIFPNTVFCHSHFPLYDVTTGVHSFKMPNLTILKPFSLNWTILETNGINAGKRFCMKDLH